VAAQVADLNEKVKALAVEAKQLKADPSAALDAETTRLTQRVEAARGAVDENEQRMRDAIAALEHTLSVLAS
jgi:hypothetical protein